MRPGSAFLSLNTSPSTPAPAPVSSPLIPGPTLVRIGPDGPARRAPCTGTGAKDTEEGMSAPPSANYALLPQCVPAALVRRGASVDPSGLDR